MVEGVIFDVGGVLAPDVWENLLPSQDKEGGIAEKFALDKEQVHKVGELLWKAFAYRSEGKHVTWRELEQQYWEMFIKFFWPNSPPNNASCEEFIRMTGEVVKPAPGHHDMQRCLKNLQSNGIRLGICSNNNEFWFRRQMEPLNLYQYFNPSSITLSCHIGVSKSSKRCEMFHAVVGALGLPYSKCVLVDDRVENIERAGQCGIRGFPMKEGTTVTELERFLGTGNG